MKLFFGFALAVILGGCSQATTPTGTEGGTSSTEPKMDNTSTQQLLDPAQRQPKDGDEVAVMETSLGRIVLMFFPDKAPNHVDNFKKLAAKGFYDGTKFHRVIPKFMIQGGDPNTKTTNTDSWGQGGPGYAINAEFNDVKHVRGILSMARTADPNSAGSQFFIMVDTAPSLDGQYSAFGKVVSGIEVVDKIVNLPRVQPGRLDRPVEPPVIKSVKIVKWPIK